MPQPSRIRLGGVLVVYDAGTGLTLSDAHTGRIELQICKADLPDLFDFIARHHTSAGTTVRSVAPHWRETEDKPCQLGAPPVPDDPSRDSQ